MSKSVEVELPNGMVVFNSANIIYIDAPKEKTELKKSEDDKNPDFKFLLVVHLVNGNAANLTFDTDENRQVEYERIKASI